MNSARISYEEFKELINRGIVKLEHREKYKNFSRDVALLYFFVLGILLIVISILIEGAIRDPFYINGWIFLTLLISMGIWFFIYGYNHYRIHRNLEKTFWEYFTKRKAKLFLIGPIEIEGEKYVLHGFKERGSGILGDIYVVTLDIKKEIHKKAMDLMEGGNYEIAVDAEGNEKVIVNGGDIREVDKDTLLVMKLIKTIYDLYRDDINEIWDRRERYKKKLENEVS